MSYDDNGPSMFIRMKGFSPMPVPVTTKPPEKRNKLWIKETVTMEPGEIKDVSCSPAPESCKSKNAYLGMVELRPMRGSGSPIIPLEGILKMRSRDNTITLRNISCETVTIFQDHPIADTKPAWYGPSSVTPLWKITKILDTCTGGYLDLHVINKILTKLDDYWKGDWVTIAEAYTDFRLIEDELDDDEYQNEIEVDGINLPSSPDFLNPEKYEWEKEIEQSTDFPDRLKKDFIDFVREETPDVFPKSEDEVGKLICPSEADLYKYDIDLTNWTPVKVDSFKMNEVKQMQMEIITERMCEIGLVHRGVSNYGFPMFCIARRAKPGCGTKIRTVIDYRLILLHHCK